MPPKEMPDTPYRKRNARLYPSEYYGIIRNEPKGQACSALYFAVSVATNFKLRHYPVTQED